MTTWMVRATTASREALRWRADTTNRGHPGRAYRTASVRPRTMVTVRRIRATRPKPLVRYHRARELGARTAVTAGLPRGRRGSSSG